MSEQRVGYHRRYELSDENTLVEVDAGPRPKSGSVKAEFEALQERQHALNRRLASPEVDNRVKISQPTHAGIYPLRVTSFTCTCEGNDEDGAAEQLTERLGNLRVITEVPFMRSADVVFAIRAQGLVDETTGFVECVDALFGGGIYWRGWLTATRFEYELLAFKRGRDTFVGRMSESIDLSHKVGEIDADLYRAEVGYHLDRESNGADGKPTLARRLDHYGSSEAFDQVSRCYSSASDFAAAVGLGDDNIVARADAARLACAAVPGKRYYQAYEAWLHGIRYDPATAVT